jgi:hypothetical protein
MSCVTCHTWSHVTRYTSHVTRYTSHVTRHTSHVTRHTSHVTHHTSHVTRHTSHVARHTSHVTRHTSHVTRHRIRAIANPQMTTAQKRKNTQAMHLRTFNSFSHSPRLFFIFNFMITRCTLRLYACTTMQDFITSRTAAHRRCKS